MNKIERAEQDFEFTLNYKIRGDLDSTGLEPISNFFEKETIETIKEALKIASQHEKPIDKDK